jgi:hypothetical protein
MENIFCEKCNSDNLHFVKYKMANGVDILRKQCYSCGYLLTLNYKRNYIQNFNSLDYHNKDFRNEFKMKAIRKGEINTVFFNYSVEHFNRSYNYYHKVYLKSKEWKEKRDLVMEFYKSKCNDCGEKATDVHHLHYNNIFKEKFEDLIPLCRYCHNKKHITYELTT